MANESICIIGGGLGGLFTGALLAKEGFRVTVLEKNHTIGGGLQTFVRDGEVYETGMHILGGLRKDGSIHKICSYLGILDKLLFRDVDDLCMDSLHYEEDGMTYKIASGREGFVTSLAKHFPQEKENLRRYVDALYAVADEVDFFYLRPDTSFAFAHSEQFLQPVEQFIASYIEDVRLRSILAYMNPMYGGMKGHTPAYIHCLLNVLYINGPSRFVDGSLQLAEALKGVIEENGGEVMAGQPVVNIQVEDRMVMFVETKNGKKYTADRYISAIHPCSLLEMMPENAMPKSYRNRLKEIPNTYSAFSVYLKLRDGVMPYINNTSYCIDNYDNVWHLGDTDEASWPHGFMFMTPPVTGQGKYARKLIITSPMSFEMVRQWENTTVGHRGSDYEQWKSGLAQKLVARLETLYPGLTDAVEKIYASSPLTIRDYYNIKEGSMYGFRKDCQNIALSQVPIFTKVRNLLLTGQNINLHGICGVPLTAVNTAEAILGQNYLVNKINTSYNEQD